MLHCVGDATVPQLQPIIRDPPFGLIRKTVFMQGLIQQYPGIVASEWTPRAIRTMHAGRKADNQQLGCSHAKRQYRPRMIIGMILAHLREKRCKPAAAPAFEQRCSSDIIHVVCLCCSLREQVAVTFADGLHSGQRALVFGCVV